MYLIMGVIIIPVYGYDRINVRIIWIFQITKSTVFKVNVAGSNGYKKTPYNNSNYDSSADWSIAQQWAGAYNIAPDVFFQNIRMVHGDIIRIFRMLPILQKMFHWEVR